MEDSWQENSIRTSIHGRYLVLPPAIEGPAPLLIGFHGYGEDAETQLERLVSIPGSGAWLIASIQGLHRFYQRRNNRVVASWMTSQNREQAIADNLAYVAACVAELEKVWPVNPRVVFAGFSQGVAMAFRAANMPGRNCSVIAVGGDVPPEISITALGRINNVLLARGSSDELYSAPQFESDDQRLRQAGVGVQRVELPCAHEWPAGFNAHVAAFLQSRTR